MKALSLFSNCGAGDLGYRAAGFDFRVLSELDPRRLAVALANHPGAVGVAGDLRETWPTVTASWKRAEGERSPDLLAACPPCQGMSSARSGLGSHDDHEAGGRDPRNLLVTVIKAVAEELKPRAIVVENVPAFLTRAVPHPESGGPISAALLLIEGLSETYEVFPMVADLADWGIPQTRKRSFLSLIRKDQLDIDSMSAFVPFPAPTHASDWGGRPTTISEFLRSLDLTPLDASSKERATDGSNDMHFVPVWSPEVYRMVAAIPPHSGKGAWANNACSKCSAINADAEAAACSVCGQRLLRPIIWEDESWRLIRGFRTSSYTRMRSDAPASTITTASGHVGSDKTIHPWENRLLSPYECAQIQTLPDDFRWGDSLKRWGHTNVREMIGEAVPPRFTKLHGEAIKAYLTPGAEASLLPRYDQRILKASRLLDSARRTAHAGAAGRGDALP